MNKFSRIVNISRRRAREGHLGLWRQLVEMAALRTLHGLGPGYYHLAGFWRRDLTWRDKTSQLTEREFQRRIGRLNPAPYRKLSHNKLPEKAILSLFAIPTPRFLGRLHARAGLDAAGRSLRNASDLVRLARERQAVRLVFKPPEGMHGKGVHIPEIAHGPTMTFREPGGCDAQSVQAYCADRLELDKGGDFLVEEYFEQHPVLSALNPASVNTVRIWVLDQGSRGHQVLLAFLRIGRGGRVVDNIHSGGIAAPIAMDTGRLGAAREVEPDFDLHPRHPEHGAQIEGIELPYWSDVQQLAQRALSVFPQLRFAGLDVAIGPSGPVVLELNLHAERTAQAITDCPTRRLLKAEG